MGVNMDVLIVVPDLDMGGVTTAAINLANEMTRRGIAVSILNMNYYKQFPMGCSEKVKILSLNGIAKYWGLNSEIVRSEKNVLKKLFLCCVGIVKKMFGKKKTWLQHVFGHQQPTYNYDVALAYKQCSPCYFYTLYCVRAKKKIGFVHGDIGFMGDVSMWVKYMYEFDKVAYVSNAVRKGFVERYPLLEKNATIAYNLVNVIWVNSCAQDKNDLTFDEDVINIVTVTRVDNWIKGCNRIPRLCSKIKENRGRCFHWYVVGEGPDYDTCVKIAEELEVLDVLTFVGSADNPYSILKEADFSVLPTKGEAFGLVVVESLVLGVPVVASYYPALVEILENEVMGLIAEQNVEDLYEKIILLLDNPSKLNRLRNNCSNYQYDNNKAYEQLESCF